jgi:hypothetical protein
MSMAVGGPPAWCRSAAEHRDSHREAAKFLESIVATPSRSISVLSAGTPSCISTMRRFLWASGSALRLKRSPFKVFEKHSGRLAIHE